MVGRHILKKYTASVFKEVKPSLHVIVWTRLAFFFVCLFVFEVNAFDSSICSVGTSKDQTHHVTRFSLRFSFAVSSGTKASPSQSFAAACHSNEGLFSGEYGPDCCL